MWSRLPTRKLVALNDISDPQFAALPVFVSSLTRKVRVASVHRHLAELIPSFGSTGHHDIPTVGLTARTSK